MAVDLSTHVLAPAVLSLSAKEMFYLMRVITTARLRLEEQYKGSIPLTREMFYISPDHPVSESQLISIKENFNQLREEGLIAIDVLDGLEKRFWEQIANGS